MAAGTGLAELKSSEWQELQQIADRFEKAWQKVPDKGEPPDLARFLPPPEDPLRKLVLHELIKSDLEARWRRSLSTGIEFYLQRYSELGKAKELPASLIYEEYRIRQTYGDKPPVTAYQRRFPDQFEEFQRLVRDEPMATNLVTITPPPGALAAAEDKARPTSAAAGTVPSNIGRTLGMVGEYSLLERIGSGSFGEVWKSLAPGGIPVAVKVLTRPVDHETAQKELESLELIKSIRHTYLLSTQAYFVSEERLYIIMELADGSLRSRLKECVKEGHNGIPLQELIRYFEESAEALDFLHRKKIQHRDVKPDNILLLERHVKVADFGLARLQGERSLMTATSSGTPAYMAPEVWSGKFSEHSDQYALAFTYAELRLDRRVFSSVSLPEMMNDHLNSTPDLEPMPEAEKQVVLRAMSKDPTKRFSSCKEFVQALDLATRKERGVPMPAHEGSAVSEARLGSGSQGQTDPWSTMGSPLPATLQNQQGTAGQTVPWHPPTVSKWPLWAGIGVTLFALIAMVTYSLKHPAGASGPSSSFVLAPPEVLVAQGKEHTFSIPVMRKNYDKEIKLIFIRLPDYVSITPLENTDDNELKVKIGAGPKANPGTYEVTVHPDGEESSNDKTLKLHIVWLPAGFEPVGDAIEEDVYSKKYFKKIVKEFDPNLRLEFVCIPKKEKDIGGTIPDPETFYIMVDKVSVGLFQKFAYESQMLGDWKKNNNPNKPRLPVMDVLPIEAYKFAQAMFGNKCNLPKKIHWEKATGYFLNNEELEGPFLGRWNPDAPLRIAISPKSRGIPLKAPIEIGSSEDDKSPYGCRDMAGNGREWLRDVEGQKPHFLPELTAGDKVLIWGKSFEDPEPFLFKDDIPRLGAEPPDQRISDVGFRVVIEP